MKRIPFTARLQARRPYPTSSRRTASSAGNLLGDGLGALAIFRGAESTSRAKPSMVTQQDANCRDEARPRTALVQRRGG